MQKPFQLFSKVEIFKKNKFKKGNANVENLRKYRIGRYRSRKFEACV